jgi:hypothetical protein
MSLSPIFIAIGLGIIVTVLWIADTIDSKELDDEDR